jgi:type IV pilus assembly protein PilC
MSNYIYKQAIAKAREDVAKGVPLSEPILQSGLFPPMVGHMTKVGEETGDLEGMLSRLADYYDEEVQIATETALAAMEPCIILVMAAVVCVLIAAIMAPMMSLYNEMGSM